MVATMISVCARAFDVVGDVVLTPLVDASDLNSMTRRVAKTKTLGGSVVVDDLGFAYGDGFIQVSFVPTVGIVESIRRLFVQHGVVTLSTREGVFLAYAVSCNLAPDESVVKFEISQRIDGGV